jgi:prolyl-tRNA synthetase
MYDSYCHIFERCGLKYIAVEADTGVMGGDVSHEFMVLSEKGEDVIVTCNNCSYAASNTVARVKQSENKSAKEENCPKIKEVNTPSVSTVDKVSEFLKVTPDKLIKTLVYIADGKPVAALVRGDHDVNETKLKKVLGCKDLEMADDKTIAKVTGGPVGFSGPVGIKNADIVSDYSVKGARDMVTGANKADAHVINVCEGRDFTALNWADIRYITKEDRCPKCGGTISISNAIEIGHTFKLGTKYSSALGAQYLDKKQGRKDIIMGCYGIGVNRIIASVIETAADNDGIVWPVSIAPYKVLVIPVNMADEKIKKAAEEVYQGLKKRGIQALLDDRDQRAGFKFKDADLIGIPVRIVIGKQFLEKGSVEIQNRKTKETLRVDMADIQKTVDNSLHI